MPSTRKQKAKEKRSRQSDVMSDLENMNIMLGNYSGNHSDEELNENPDLDSRSNGIRTDMVRNCEDFRTLLNQEDRTTGDISVETTRLITDEITQQMLRKVDELKRDLNSQIAETITSLIIERILPSNQITMTNQNSVFREEMDQRSGRLNRTAEEKNARNALKTNSKPILANSCRRDYFRGKSDVSQTSDEDHDILAESHDKYLVDQIICLTRRYLRPILLLENVFLIKFY